MLRFAIRWMRRLFGRSDTPRMADVGTVTFETTGPITIPVYHPPGPRYQSSSPASETTPDPAAQETRARR